MKLKRNWALGIMSTVLVFVLAGCGGDSTPTSPPASQVDPVSPTVAAQPATLAPTDVPVAKEAATATSAPTAVKTTPVSSDAPSELGKGESKQGSEAEGSNANRPLVAADPGYREELSSSGLRTGGWETDFSFHTVPFDSILSGGPPRDGIPPIDNPTFVEIKDADEWLETLEPVVSFELNGDARAYPLQILMWHEIVNDTVGGAPVSVTFCPLCNSAIVFDRNINDLVLTFGTSGMLRKSDLIMWDRQTESWWQRLIGEALVGRMAGTKLNFLAAPIMSWQDFKTHHPDGLVLSKDTGFRRNYGENPYVGYDRIDNPPFLYSGDLDGCLQSKERVAAITVDGVDFAFPFLFWPRKAL